MSTFFRLKTNLATLPYMVTNWPLNNHIVMKYCFLESKYGMKQFVLTFVPCLVLWGSNEQRKYQFALKIILRECTTQSVCMATIVLRSNPHAMREWKWSRCSFSVWSRKNNDQCFLVMVVGRRLDGYGFAHTAWNDIRGDFSFKDHAKKTLNAINYIFERSKWGGT